MLSLPNVNLFTFVLLYSAHGLCLVDPPFVVVPFDNTDHKFAMSFPRVSILFPRHR